MERDVVPLAPAEWPVLYRMMVQQDFPGVPPSYENARPYFETSRILGVKRGSEVLAAFVIGEPEEGVSFLDVVCAPKEEGKWASRGVVRALCREAFGTMGLRCLWVQAWRRGVLHSALQAGFVPTTALDCAAPVLAITPWLAKRWMNEKEMKGHGKSV